MTLTTYAILGTVVFLLSFIANSMTLNGVIASVKGRPDAQNIVIASIAYNAVTSAIGAGIVWPLVIIYHAVIFIIGKRQKLFGTSQPITISVRPNYAPSGEEFERDAPELNQLFSQHVEACADYHPFITVNACMRAAWLLLRQHMLSSDQQLSTAQNAFVDIAEDVCGFEQASGDPSEPSGGKVSFG